MEFWIYAKIGSSLWGIQRRYQSISFSISKRLDKTTEKVTQKGNSVYGIPFYIVYIFSIFQSRYTTRIASLLCTTIWSTMLIVKLCDRGIHFFQCANEIIDLCNPTDILLRGKCLFFVFLPSECVLFSYMTIPKVGEIAIQQMYWKRVRGIEDSRQ